MKRYRIVAALAVWLAFVLPCTGMAGNYQPAPENLQARKTFQDNKFGIFLHWGLYSMMAQGEWYLNSRNLDSHVYAQFAGGFCPSKFDAAQWVSAFKAGGARYICFTSRHHEGFSMFHTKWSPYNIVDATPFKRDVVGELVGECHKQGLKVYLYYSLVDWTREDYYPLGKTGHGTGRTTHGEWSSYFQFMKNQLTELLTNYGRIDGIWFDGMWDQPADFNWHMEELYDLIHRLQPACMVGNNHHRALLDGEDFQMFERDMPGENTTGFSEGQQIGALPLETCETMNGMWGYKIEDQNYKTPEEIIRFLVKTAGLNANLLLNIGPMPSGQLPDLALDRLAKVGDWLQQYGETIYGTRGGEIAPQSWGVTTRKGDRLFVHVLNPDCPSLVLPLKSKVKSIKAFATREPIPFKRTKEGVTLTLDKVPAGIDRILEIQ